MENINFACFAFVHVDVPKSLYELLAFWVNSSRQVQSFIHTYHFHIINHLNKVIITGNFEMVKRNSNGRMACVLLQFRFSVSLIHILREQIFKIKQKQSVVNFSNFEGRAWLECMYRKQRELCVLIKEVQLTGFRVETIRYKSQEDDNE